MATPAYPVFLHLTNQPVLIVGGGNVALRKARGLIEAQAAITVISPSFTPALEQLPNITRLLQTYASSCITVPETPRWRLVFAATNAPAVNRQVAADAQACDILCCRCDGSDEGDFSNGSVWRKEHVILAVGTSGASPVLAARIGRLLAEKLDPDLVELCTLLDAWRAIAMAEVADPFTRAAILRRLAGDEMLNVLRAGGPPAAQQLFQDYLAATKAPRPGAGEKLPAND